MSQGKENHRVSVPMVSVVTTLYRSQPYIEEFFRRSFEAASKVAQRVEFVFVNDGSPDDSAAVVRELIRKNTGRPEVSIRLIDLSRNFGHHRAMMTGLKHAQGDLVFLVDSDLEEKPELIEDFYARLVKNPGIDVVFGVREKRTESYFKGLFGTLFYKVFNAISETKLPEGLCVVRLMTRRFVDNLMRFEETEFIIAGLWQLTGFGQMPVSIQRGYKGSSSYSPRKQIRLALIGLVSFSSRPLHLIFASGLVISFLSFLVILWSVAVKLIYQTPQSGFTAIMASVWFLGGLILFAIGTLGLYLSMVYKEVKKRPLVVIREVDETPNRAAVVSEYGSRT